MKESSSPLFFSINMLNPVVASVHTHHIDQTEQMEFHTQSEQRIKQLLTDAPLLIIGLLAVVSWYNITVVKAISLIKV